jgi:hypothetical protein
MHWQRLDRDNSIKVIDSVKSESNAGLFSVATSEVQRARLPFYQNHHLYKITNYASLPSFSFQFLGDGLFFHYLDGTEGPIYAVNDKGAIRIDEPTLVPYLEFFFSHVSDEFGDTILINNPHDMPLLDSLDMDAYAAVFSQHKPVRIEYDGGIDGYIVEADLYRESQMVRAKIQINAKGRVKVLEQKMIMHEVLDSGHAESVL